MTRRQSRSRWRVRAALALMCVIGGAAPLLPRNAHADTAGYWHTSGARIIDANGHPIRIAAVNWFGMEDIYWVPAGLDRQPLDAITARVEQLGFNAIRLPWSDEMVERNPVVWTHLGANPELRGLHALTILDRIVASAGRHHLRIILNNSRSDAGTKPQPSGLWYTSRYPESAWIRDWKTLVLRYLGNSTVVAADLRNEPHTAPPGPWSLHAYLAHGATWGPYGGRDNRKTDWRLAAERAGNAILTLNPHLLIVVEGLQLYPDAHQSSGVDRYWWGGQLQAAARYPVRLAVPHQLVYSPHEYGPFKHQMPFFGRGMTYSSILRVWERHWAYLGSPGTPYQTPIFIGEFGTCGQSVCVHDSRPASAGLWFGFLMRYLREHPEISWAFWALNGTSHQGDECPNYILRADWHTVRLPPLITALRAVSRPG